MRLRVLRTRCPASFGRRLLFEELERRDLLAVMRLVDWNTLNGPNDASGDANFQTVLQAIGNETVQGNTERIDILALQETDPAGPGGDSIGRIQTILNGLYPSTTYSSVVTPSDGGGDSTGFVYDNSSVSLLESVQIGSGSLTHNVLRGKFKPVGAADSSIFYVYSIHLKSGTSGSDATQRGSEAALLRADADSLGEGTQVLFVGDFNMKGSDEVAYTNIVAAGAGQLQDVANAPGHWTDNPAFKTLHSQDPGAAMDDRFDIQFATGELFDGVGVDYVPNSFHVFGNNGTHTLNQPITTGTGASVAVLNALVAASDHLPAVGDYQLVGLAPNVRISETLGSTKVVEGGLYDTYQVVLDTVPAADVTVTVSPNSQVDVGGGAGNQIQLTFTHANALTPQTVVVHAADDALLEGNHNGLITHSSASADLTYDALPVASVNVAIVDNDAPALVINEVDTDQTDTDTQEFVEIYDGGVGHVSLNGKSLVLFTGSTDTAYTVIPFTASDFTDANGFYVVGDSGVSPAPNKLFATSSNSIQNGADAIALYSGSFPNGGAVTTTNLIDALVYDTGQADDSGLLVLLQSGQPQINENQHSLGTSESMSRVPDGASTIGGQRQTSSYTEQAPTPGTYNAAQTYGVQIIQSAGRVDVQEGGTTDSYQLALVSIPTANVQITVDPDNQTNLGAGAGTPIVLTFTPANALIPQTVTVTAVDDATPEGNHTSIISNAVVSSDSHYNGLAVSNVIANIVDNDAPVPINIVISELMYDPKTDESSPGIGEWIEVVNAGPAPQSLSGWQFDYGPTTVWGAIPSGIVLNPKQSAVFFDTAFTTAATFRSEWKVPDSSLVVGISWRNLKNNPGAGDAGLSLRNDVGTQMDFVNYDNVGPSWPSDQEGKSIYLTDLAADNNNGANWARSTTAVKAWQPTGPTFVTGASGDFGTPGWVLVAADYNRNETVDAADFVLWRKTLTSTTNLFADGSGNTVGTPNGVVDQADYTYWRSKFGTVLSVSGAGSGTGASELAVPMPTEPEQPTVSDDPIASTSATIELRNALSNSGPATGSGLTLQRSSLVVAAGTGNLLLSVVQRDSASQLNDVQAGKLDSAGDEHNDAVDEFYTSLGDANLAVGAVDLLPVLM
jgi:endonuclease/exonuclease/phosphatase family metal-dependent hydrolase